MIDQSGDRTSIPPTTCNSPSYLPARVPKLALHLLLRDLRINKIPERGSAGFARTPSLWDFMFKRVP